MTTYLYFVLISIKTSPEKFNICFRGYSSPGQLGVHWTMFNIELWLGHICIDEEWRRATRHAMIGMIKYRLLKVAVVLGQSKHIKATKSRQQYQGNNIKGGTISQLFSICCCRWQLGARSPINSEHWKPPNTIQDNTIQHHSIPCNWGPVVQ